MCCGFNNVMVVNIVLCFLILAAGCIGYIKTRNKAPFHIGVAFGLFGVSHVITLMGVESSMGSTMVLLRVFGYVIVLLTMVRVWLRG